MPRSLPRRRRHPLMILAALLLLSTLAAAVLTGCWFALDFAAAVAAQGIVDQAINHTPSPHP